MKKKLTIITIFSLLLVMGISGKVLANNKASALLSEKTQFLLKIDDIEEKNAEMLKKSSDKDVMKATITFNRGKSVEEIEKLISDNNVKSKAVYLRFTEGNGTIGTGYQLIEEDGSIDDQHIKLMENRSIKFEGVVSLEMLISSTEYNKLNAIESVYVIDLAGIDDAFPESHFWELDKAGLSETK